MDRNDLLFLAGSAMIWYGIPVYGVAIIGVVFLLLALIGAYRKAA